MSGSLSVGHPVQITASFQKGAEKAIREDVKRAVGVLVNHLSWSWFVEEIGLEVMTPDMVLVTFDEFGAWEEDTPKVRATVLIVGERPCDETVDKIRVHLFSAIGQSLKDRAVAYEDFVLMIGWISGLTAAGSIGGQRFEL